MDTCAIIFFSFSFFHLLLYSFVLSVIIILFFSLLFYYVHSIFPSLSLSHTHTHARTHSFIHSFTHAHFFFDLYDRTLVLFLRSLLTRRTVAIFFELKFEYYNIYIIFFYVYNIYIFIYI